MSRAPAADGGAYPTGYSKLFWVALAVGGFIMAVGVRGLLVNSGSVMDTNPSRWVVLFVAVIAIHDAVLAPLVLAVGYGVSRLVPARLRPVIQGGLICSALVVLFAFPFVRGYGAMPTNPTILPRDYTRGLLTVLAVVWVVTAAMAAVVSWRGRTTLPVAAGDTTDAADNAQTRTVTGSSTS